MLHFFHECTWSIKVHLFRLDKRYYFYFSTTDMLRLITQWGIYRVFHDLGHNCRRWFPRSLWSKKFI